MANKQIKIKKIRDNAQLPQVHNGNWCDCYCNAISRIGKSDIGQAVNWNLANETLLEAGMLAYGQGDIIIVYLGFAMDMGKGYEAHLIPRSSTFTNKGLIQTNSIGLIDDSYCGDDDELRIVFYATRPGTIRIGDRLAQMTIQKSNPIFELKEVNTLGNENRNGYGSTGE